MSLYDEITNDLPGVREANRGLAAISDQLKTIRSAPDTSSQRADLLAEVLDAARTGQPFPDDLGPRAHTIANHGEINKAAHAYLLEAERALEVERRLATFNGKNAALVTLRPLLADVVHQVRELLPRLDGVTNAQQAISAGPVEAAAWAKLGPLGKRYQEIRTTQLGFHLIQPDEGSAHWMTLPDGSTVEVFEPLRLLGEVANYAELHPDWDRTRRENLAEIRRQGNARVLVFDDPVTHLLDLVRNPDAQLWVPTGHELGAKYIEAKAIAAEYTAAQRDLTEGRTAPGPQTEREMRSEAAIGASHEHIQREATSYR